jgi:hypothetical protein
VVLVFCGPEWAPASAGTTIELRETYQHPLADFAQSAKNATCDKLRVFAQGNTSPPSPRRARRRLKEIPCARSCFDGRTNQRDRLSIVFSGPSPRNNKRKNFP